MVLPARAATGAAVFSSLVLLGACSAQAPVSGAAAAKPADCVTLAEGTYEISNGRILVTSFRPVGAASTNQATAWAADIGASFAGLGFPWMTLKVRDRIATITGTAPDAETKTRALTAAESAIAAHPQAGQAGLLIVDGISVEGGQAGVGAGLAALSDTGISVESCQTAFNETMAGRNVTFQSDLAIISPVSARLLDAATGVATLCQQFSIEIGGHTDTRGSDERNLTLSQDRAEAVRGYLVGKGVPEASLVAKGYGESVPLDPAQNEEAYARNRRTEFKVQARQ